MNGNSDQHKPGERIAKVIARAGLASRREAEDWIAAGLFDGSLWIEGILRVGSLRACLAIFAVE